MRSLSRGFFRFWGHVLPWVLVCLLAVEVYPSRTSNIELNRSVDRLSGEVSRLRKEQAMPTLVLKRHRNSICYIYSVYSLQRPVFDWSRRAERHTRVSGTGFVVADGIIATNRHVVEPWYEDPDDEALIATGAVPKVEKIVAFFPTQAKSVPLTEVQVSPDHDLAIARFEPTARMQDVSPLPLADGPGIPGDTVVVVGYPLGVSAMLAKSPRNVYKRLAASRDTIGIATELAERDLIRPSSTYGHLGDIVGEKLIYDAPTAQGGSGGPVFNSEGQVIAVNAAYIDGFTGGTIGITVEALKPLIRNAMAASASRLAQNITP